MQNRMIVCAAVLSLAIGCGKSSSPTAPTPTPPVATPAPPPVTPVAPVVPRVSVAGVVTDADTGRPVGTANVRVSGTDARTDGNGYYSLSGILAGPQSMVVTAPGYNTSTENVTVQNTDTRLDRRLAPFWTRTGVGDNVFDMPTYVQRVRVQATTASSCQNFIVRLRGSGLINVILGTCTVADTRALDSTYLAGGGVVSITSSSGVSWTFSQTQ